MVNGTRRQSTTLEVVHRHKKLVQEFGVEFRPMVPISGANFWNERHCPSTVCDSDLCVIRN